MNKYEVIPWISTMVSEQEATIPDSSIRSIMPGCMVASSSEEGMKFWKIIDGPSPRRKLGCKRIDGASSGGKLGCKRVGGVASRRNLS
jgi:hypothetical protein